MWWMRSWLHLRALPSPWRADSRRSAHPMARMPISALSCTVLHPDLRRPAVRCRGISLPSGPI